MNHLPLNEFEFLDQIEDIIEENFDNDKFDVGELASQAGISRSSLHRKIKAVAGIPAGVFLRTSRLERAKELLEQTSSNITQIAFECGFSSLTYFDICFKNHFGYSPGKYRKEMLAENGSELRGKMDSFRPVRRNARANPINELHNFPVPVTSFIGRKEEMKIISELLLKYRVVSLVGAGGCGKTRLACEVIPQIQQKIDDGIWFVDLAALQHGEFVVREVMKTLHISEASDEDPLEILVRNVRYLNCLILLDNCEHLAEEVARVADRLSQSVAGIKILVTSRVALNAKGENVWRIPTLSLADPEKVKGIEQVNQSEAVQLFTERARLSDPRFELTFENSRDIAMITKQLDGIPLAIELVASRIRFMDPAIILSHLSGKFSALESLDPGIPDRHKTLNEAISWSYALLLKEEKLLFSRLSVFSGGFYLEAAKAVCSDESLPAEYILDLLSNLIGHSMVNTIRIPGQPIRYVLLETIRQYGWELLTEKNRNRLQRKHLDYFIEVAENAYRERMSSHAYWIGRLNIEFENMHVALSRTEYLRRSKYAHLAGLLAWYWTRSGKISLSGKILGNIINEKRLPAETRARILSGYGWANAFKFELWPELVTYAKRCVRIWQQMGNKNEESIATTDLATIIHVTGETSEGLKLARKAYELAKIENNPGVVLNSLLALSQALVNLKRCEELIPVVDQILELADELENFHAKFVGHHNSGDCAAIRGKFNHAEKEYGKGLEATVQLGDTFYLLNEIMGIAISVSGMGRYVKALRLAGAANEQARKNNSTSREELPLQFWQELIKEHIVGAREKLGEELTRKYEAEGAAMELEEAIAYALDFKKD